MLKVIGHYFPSNTLQQVILDALLVFVAAMLAVGLQSGGADLDWQIVVPSALGFAGVMILMNSFMGLYRLRCTNDAPARESLARVMLALVVSVPVALVVFRLLPWHHVASQAAQVSVVMLLCLVLLMRGMVNRRASAPVFLPRVMVVGTGEQAAAVARVLQHPGGLESEVVGFFPAALDEVAQVEPRRIINHGTGLLDAVRTHRVNEIVVAVRECRGGVLPLRELLDCKMLGVPVLDLSSFYERSQGQVRLDSLRASWLIYGDGFRQGMVRTFVKRCFDLFFSTLLLLLALPVMLVTALLILLEDGAPVFYRQERVGRGGRVFRVIKFRSMRRDAEKDGKPRWATSDDDRMTRVGRVIRRLRIDELPQLINVLVGDMSLVGPRPERPYFVDQLAQEVPFYAVRHSVKPGVTGWAQVRYQYGSSVDDAVQKLQYDLYYVKNHSLVLDTVILFETVRVVLLGEGAQ